MIRQTRREFLTTAAIAGGATLAPWGGALAQQPAAPVPAGSPLAMVIAKWKDSPAPEGDLKAVAEKLTRQAIGALGGMERFVQKGSVVWVKPNIAWDRTPEQAANTNPDVVATLVKMCLDAGAKKVKVGDKTCNPAQKAYPASGIEAAAKAAGAEVVYLDDNRFRDMDLKGERLQMWPLYPEIIECDVVINVPVAKHHNISTATLCMKNYMGVIGGERGQWHQDIPTCLADLTAFMKPTITVLDAIRILATNGPTGGNLKDVKRLDTLAASTDIVALDAFGATLLGLDPKNVATVVKGQERGLGQMDYTKLACQEIAVS